MRHAGLICRLMLPAALIVGGSPAALAEAKQQNYLVALQDTDSKDSALCVVYTPSPGQKTVNVQVFCAYRFSDNLTRDDTDENGTIKPLADAQAFGNSVAEWIGTKLPVRDRDPDVHQTDEHIQRLVEAFESETTESPTDVCKKFDSHTTPPWLKGGCVPWIGDWKLQPKPISQATQVLYIRILASFVATGSSSKPGQVPPVPPPKNLTSYNWKAYQDGLKDAKLEQKNIIETLGLILALFTLVGFLIAIASGALAYRVLRLGASNAGPLDDVRPLLKVLTGENAADDEDLSRFATSLTELFGELNSMLGGEVDPRTPSVTMLKESIRRAKIDLGKAGVSPGEPEGPRTLPALVDRANKSAAMLQVQVQLKRFLDALQQQPEYVQLKALLNDTAEGADLPFEEKLKHLRELVQQGEHLDQLKMELNIPWNSQVIDYVRERLGLLSAILQLGLFPNSLEEARKIVPGLSDVILRLKKALPPAESPTHLDKLLESAAAACEEQKVTLDERTALVDLLRSRNLVAETPVITVKRLSDENDSAWSFIEDAWSTAMRSSRAETLQAVRSLDAKNRTLLRTAEAYVEPFSYDVAMGLLAGKLVGTNDRLKVANEFKSQFGSIVSTYLDLGAKLHPEQVLNVTKQEAGGPARSLRFTLIAGGQALNEARRAVQSPEGRAVLDLLELESVSQSVDDFKQKLIDYPGERLWQLGLSNGFSQSWLHKVFRADALLRIYFTSSELAPLCEAISVLTSGLRRALRQFGKEVERLDPLSRQPAGASVQGADAALVRLQPVREAVEKRASAGDRDFIVDPKIFGYREADGNMIGKAVVAIYNPADWK